MRYLTTTKILVLHARLLQITGGSGGLLDLGALESALARPQTTFEGADLYTTLWDKAGTLMESLCQNHPFVDGNKRVALVATGIFLEDNGYTLTAGNEQVYEFTMQIAKGEIRCEAISRWLEAHSTPL